MKKPAELPFLAREAYRRRRRLEGLRLLPVAGVLLFLLPILWTSVEGQEASTSGGLFYVFICWLVLIVIAFVFSRYAHSDDDLGGGGAGDDR